MKKQPFQITDFGKQNYTSFKINKKCIFIYQKRESLGFAIAYAYSDYLCVRIKLYLLIFYLTAGMLGYGVIEVLLKVKKVAQITPF